MKHATLQAQVREANGSRTSGRLRREGKLPAVLYGHELSSINLTLNTATVEQLFGHEGFHGLIELEIEGAPKEIAGNGKVLSLVKAFQADPISRVLTHVDFYKVNLKERVAVTIPVHVAGTAPGVKAGGIMEVIRRELEVHCLPDKIPGFISVDVSSLELGHSIHIQDITLPEGVEIRTETNFTIVSVAAPSKIEEPVVAAEGAEVAAGAEDAEGKAEEGKAGGAKAGEKKSEG